MGESLRLKMFSCTGLCCFHRFALLPILFFPSVFSSCSPCLPPHLRLRLCCNTPSPIVLPYKHAHVVWHQLAEWESFKNRKVGRLNGLAVQGLRGWDLGSVGAHGIGRFCGVCILWSVEKILLVCEGRDMVYM